ncbi:sigma-w pathway protein ysdB [Halobacillus litoralis]|uniref:Sigma-w pathway protein ysdB n=1 Tax=Halobacillus litoralis TaxID=45668 RepID=A0A845FCS2_9BACI|nr:MULTISPECIES: sigma-w pathway protein ysdB [Halobacillus]MBN9655318.1 sigma-w pathway protein ysdB [Halobacillus sp. GSS1]MEC3882849.1 sigma-w pathway protein ysdB [Halobacillus sp. HZG1]MYL72262.1 sigma-w pathway protein ysdB [Halobacillus litoralis]
MIILLFRLLLLIAIAFIIYTAYKFIVNPRRKLELARDKKEFYFHDNKENTKENFLMTLKGHVFEGEKYLGTTEDSFEVINISVSVHNPEKLQGLDREDLYFMEKEILIRYPYASIEWKYPMNRLIIHPLKNYDEKKPHSFE